jgi:hypothetical protein
MRVQVKVLICTNHILTFFLLLIDAVFKQERLAENIFERFGTQTEAVVEKNPTESKLAEIASLLHEQQAALSTQKEQMTKHLSLMRAELHQSLHMKPNICVDAKLLPIEGKGGASM